MKKDSSVIQFIGRLRTKSISSSSSSNSTNLSYHKNDELDQECKLLSKDTKVYDLFDGADINIDSIRKRLSKTKSIEPLDQCSSQTNSCKRSETMPNDLKLSSSEKKIDVESQTDEVAQAKAVTKPQKTFKMPFFLIKYKNKVGLIIIFMLYFMLKSIFLTGFIIGMSLTMLITHYYMSSTHKNEEVTQNESKICPYASIKEDYDQNLNGEFKGWLNELSETYSPETYYLNKTQSVYITLSGCTLRLQKCLNSNEIPKRALLNEHLVPKESIEQRMYDLSDARIHIQPSNLCRKRYWSKKYPICIEGAHLQSGSKCSTKVITLFARCDRDKETWFNLFKKASNKEFFKIPPTRLQVQKSYLKIDKSLLMLNTFLVRIFQDFFEHEKWINHIQSKIQNKINTIRLPHFIEDILITELSLGKAIPLIEDTSEPWLDSNGLWSHLNIDYQGGFKMSLSTKLNLLSLKKQEANGAPPIASRFSRVRHVGMINSDEEDSPEETDDETLPESDDGNKKFIRYVNRLASSTYFQKVTDNKYIRNVMTNVSNTHLMLSVEVKRIKGTLALNIPPHMSDRLWYGFIQEPVLSLVVTPHVGDKEISYQIVSDWLSDRLRKEFQKVFVYPNMDDLCIPLLKSEID